MRPTLATVWGGLVAAMAACGPTSSPPPTLHNGVDAGNLGDIGTTVDASDVAVSMADASDVPTAAQQAQFMQFITDVQSRLTANNAPGASVAVVLNGHLAFATGVGMRNVAMSEPVTTGTLFHVASMSKMVVAATALSLSEHGLLNLNTPITSYLPWFQVQAGFDASGITMAHLLSHTSGFPCDTIPQCDVTSSGPRQAFFMANPQPLWYPTGAAYDYSNTEFALAASVIEAADGMADGQFEQIAHDRVFVPAGMTTATYDSTLAETLDHATGYLQDAHSNVTGSIEPASQACPLLDPPGGINATATDYAHFAETLLANGGTMLSPASVALMEAGHANMRLLPTLQYCYGLMQQDAPPYATHLSVWHDGSLPGFTSEMWMVPDYGFAVVALVNVNGGTMDVPDRIVSDALDVFIGIPRSNPSGRTPIAMWSGYVGTYDDPVGTLGTGITVSLDPTGTMLLVNAPNATNFAGQPAAVNGAMTQSAYDGWSMPDGTFVTFFPDATGTYRYFVTRRGVGIRS